jgi:hypothetical protein
MKQKKIYHTVRTVPKSYRNILERGKIDTPNTQLHDRSLSQLGTKKSDGATLVLLTQASPLIEMMR